MIEANLCFSKPQWLLVGNWQASIEVGLRRTEVWGKGGWDLVKVLMVTSEMVVWSQLGSGQNQRKEVERSDGIFNIKRGVRGES